MSIRQIAFPSANYFQLCKGKKKVPSAPVTFIYYWNVAQQVTVLDIILGAFVMQATLTRAVIIWKTYHLI